MNSNVIFLLFVISCACVAIQALPAARQEQGIETIKNACVLPMVRGVCRARMPRWGYDSVKNDCVEFYYGGCLGNENNFFTKEECLKVCKGV